MNARAFRLNFWPRALSLRSMRGRMALLLGLAMLPAGAIAMQVGLTGVSARQAAYEESLGRRALQAISAERSAVDQVREMLRVMASAPEIINLTDATCRDWLLSVAERYPNLASLAITTEAGRIRCSIPQSTTSSASLRAPLRQRAAARDAFVMGYSERGALTGVPVLAAMEPLRDAGGRRVGFISASIAISHLRTVLDQGRAADGARAALVDYTGRIIVESSVPAPGVPSLPSPRQLQGELGSANPVFIDIKGGVAVLAPLHSPDLYIVMAWAPDQPAWRRSVSVALSVLAPLLIWLLAIGAGWFAIEIYVARPLSNLESAARAFARGEEVNDPPALAAAPEEIRSLRRTLAAMAKTLRGREQRLIEALAEERALLREVHHRVKNNLQMVASLLNIQARGASDESEAWGLARAHDRVQLLALVHQRIYASGEVRELRVDELAADIARQLLQSHGRQDVKMSFHLSEVRARADRAVPLAFLIGESLSAVLEALDGEATELRLWMAQEESGEVRFAIDADGVGASSPGASGRLIDAFARQLGAQVGRDSARPLVLWVRVPPPRD